MDGSDRRRSQYGQPYQSQTQPRNLPGQPMGPPSSERYPTPTTPARSDIGRSSMTRSYLPGYSSYGYGDQPYAGSQMQSSSPMQGVEMQYQSQYMHDASRQQQVQAAAPQQQHQTFTQYGQSAMLPPVGSHSIYGMQQFQGRPSDATAIEVMSTQFAVPQYLPQGEHGGMGVGQGSAHYMTSQPEQASYTTLAASRPSLPQPYVSSHGEYPVMEHAPESGQQQLQQDTGHETLEQELRDYQQNLRSAFDAIIAGRVTEASEKIVSLSRWLVNNVTHLGLHHDDESKHAERIDLWREFNLAWEALGQKQKDITEEALRTRRQPTDILSAQAITTLVDELVNLCDQIEQCGLVDFEMGIWEEQITDVFISCLDLLPQGDSSSLTGRSKVSAT